MRFPVVPLEAIRPQRSGAIGGPGGSFAALRKTSLGIALLTASCAHVEAPPGGPEDRTPPSVASTSPESEAVVESYDGPVVFRFDERISETGVQDAVIVSPRTSPVEVSHGRSEIRVSLRNGWEPNAIYQVTLGTEVRDLFGNRLPAPIPLVFSTGPEIPDTRVTGTAIERVTGRPATEHRVEAIRMADSLVYAAQTGAQGEFEFSRIPEGEYRFRTFQDINRNRALEEYEPRDSSTATVAAGEPVELAFRVLTPDSTGPTIDSMELSPPVIEVEFDDYLDPEQTLDVGQVTIQHPTAGTVEVGRVAIGDLPTAGAPAAQPAEPSAGNLPSRTLRVELAEGTELAPGAEYAVRIAAIRNVNGVTADAEATLEVPDPDPDR